MSVFRYARKSIYTDLVADGKETVVGEKTAHPVDAGTKVALVRDGEYHQPFAQPIATAAETSTNSTWGKMSDIFRGSYVFVTVLGLKYNPSESLLTTSP